MQAIRWALASLLLASACTSVSSVKGENLQDYFGLSDSRVKRILKEHGDPLERARRGLPQFLFGDAVALADDDQSWVEGVYLPSRNSSIVRNEKCTEDVNSIIKVLENPVLQGLLFIRQHFWHYLMLDSWGKFGDGLLDGNFNLWGFPWECGFVQAQDDFPLYDIHMNFSGRYCLIHIESTDQDRNESDYSSSRITPALAATGPFNTLQYATCMPSSCSSDDMRVSMNERLKDIGKYARHVDCGFHEEIQLDDASNGYIALLGFLGSLILGAALVDWFIGDRDKLRKGPLRYLLVFSITKSLSKIFKIDAKPSRSVITCLHGMRVLSLTWVVWIHSYYVKMNISKNTIGQLRLSSDIISQTLVNATFSVDTFFFMSGLLVVFGLMRQFAASGKVCWASYYVHRVIRLLPAIALTCGMAATLAKLSLIGPYGGEINRNLVENCRSNWWRDVFFLSNIMTTPSCLQQCWYTAVDTQIYIVLPIVLIPLIYRRNIGLVWLALVTTVFLCLPPILYSVQDLVPDQLFMLWWPAAVGLESQELSYPNSTLYDKPWGRAGVYLIGCWTGYLIFAFRNVKVHMKVWQALIGWLLAAVVACLVLFGMTDYNSYDRGDDFSPEPLSEALSVAYGGLSRPAWALCLMWVVFACHNGYGSLINDFLSHPSWQPLSRLSFTLYLVSYPLQLMYTGSIALPLYVDNLSTLVETCGYLFVSGLIAMWLSTTAETPLIGLGKLVFSPPEKEEEEEETETVD